MGRGVAVVGVRAVHEELADNLDPTFVHRLGMGRGDEGERLCRH